MGICTIEKKQVGSHQRQVASFLQFFGSSPLPPVGANFGTGRFHEMISTRQLPMGADHCPWGGHTDRIVCNIHEEVCHYSFREEIYFCYLYPMSSNNTTVYSAVSLIYCIWL